MIFRYFVSELDLSDDPQFHIPLRKAFQRYLKEKKILKEGDTPFRFLIPEGDEKNYLKVSCEKGLECVCEEINVLNLREKFDLGYIEKHMEDFYSCLKTSCREEDVPVIIAVEHALSLSGIKYALHRYGGKKCGVLIFDAHLDLFELWERAKMGGFYYPRRERSSTIHSGNFLKYAAELCEKHGSEIFITGVQEIPPEAERFLKRGLRVLTGKEFDRNPSEILTSFSRDFIYLSFDADVCAGGYASAVRNLNYTGVREDSILQFAESLSLRVKCGKIKIAGLDLCEIFPPLAFIEEDKTFHFWKEVLGRIRSSYL